MLALATSCVRASKRKKRCGGRLCLMSVSKTYLSICLRGRLTSSLTPHNFSYFVILIVLKLLLGQSDAKMKYSLSLCAAEKEQFFIPEATLSRQPLVVSPFRENCCFRPRQTEVRCRVRLLSCCWAAQPCLAS